MSGFVFRYRLSGGAPTVESLPFRNGELLAEGDMLTRDDGRVRLGHTGDGSLIGAATEPASAPASSIAAITDADAVYGVVDGFARKKDGRLDLAGMSGSHGVAEGGNGDFSVVVESSDSAETLVRISAGKHSSDGLTGGQLNAALARAVVRIHRDYIGRGPTKAHAFFRDNVVVVILEDVMTRAEHSLAQSGQGQVVLDIRRRFQGAMEQTLVAAVEQLTGRKVVAFLSDNQIDPDMASEVFVLDRSVVGESAPGP
jgi:uncharacterized protein YbcI